MSPSAYSYQPVTDRNCVLRQKIIALAQRHRRYGAGMIYLKLRQAGELVNYKRVDRLYAQAGLQVKRRKRKKIPLAEQHPLERPTAANQMWSMDFVFDRTAEGSSIKNLTVVDDAHRARACTEWQPPGAYPGSVGQYARVAQGDQNRQRQGVLRPCNGELDTCARRATVPDRTGQTQPEHLHRIIQWTIQR